MRPDATFDYKNRKSKTQFVVVNVKTEVFLYFFDVFSSEFWSDIDRSYIAGICEISGFI